MATIINNNRKSKFKYEILIKYIAGIKLYGSEVKSIKNNDVSISEAYCYIENNTILIKNMHIAEYKESGKYQNHNPTRDRVLLLNKIEIKKLKERVNQKGLTIIPLAVLLTDTGLIKIEIGLAKGKNLYDHRNDIKEREQEKEISREAKIINNI